MGPNGAGKTTLVRVLSGRVRLDHGTVRLGGADPLRDASARRRLGLVPQDIALYPFLTVRENLEVLGRLAGLGHSELRDAVTRALASSGLGSRASERVERLSGGLQRRVNVAAGMLHLPEVLLLDEPTVGIDPAARDEIHALLRSLRDRGMSILVTTHDMEQAEQLADRIAVMSRGRIRAEGTLADLVRVSFEDAREVQLTLASEAAAGKPLLQVTLNGEKPAGEGFWFPPGAFRDGTNAIRIANAGPSAVTIEGLEVTLRFSKGTGR